MNKVIMIGRLTREPEIRYSQGMIRWRLPDTLWQWNVGITEMLIRQQTLLIVLRSEDWQR